MIISLIAAVGQNLELGKDNDLIFRLPSDLDFFRRTTLGHPIIMGLNTWISLPRPLPGRPHFIIARPGEIVPAKSGATTYQELPFAANDDPKLQLYHTSSEKSIEFAKNPQNSPPIFIVRDLSAFFRHLPENPFIIGGASIYRQFLPLADQIYLTEISASAPADVFFPDFDRTRFTRTVLASGTENGLDFAHVLYKRKELK